MEVVHINQQQGEIDGLYNHQLTLTNQTANIFNDLMFFLDLDKEDIPKVLEFIKDLKNKKQFIAKNASKYKKLTLKEKEVLFYVVSGLTSKQIAKELHIETSTVSTHRKNIKKKLNTQSLLLWKKFYEAYKNTDI